MQYGSYTLPAIKHMIIWVNKNKQIKA